MSDKEAPRRRFHYYRETPNKEEQARIEKLAAETALLNAQLEKTRREDATLRPLSAP